MNLRPRRVEDPEINLISLIDVLLVLVVFLLLSTTFVVEGRVRIHLPEASSVPISHAPNNPITITVSQAGSYRVNDREVINASADALRAAVERVGRSERKQAVMIRADARATHQAVITAMDVLGQLGYAEIQIATVHSAGAAPTAAARPAP
jgi:biopolymer transport protein ExbD